MPPTRQLSRLARSLRYAEAGLPRSIAPPTLTLPRSFDRSRQQKRSNGSTSFERYGPAKDLLPPPDKPAGSLPAAKETAPDSQPEAKADEVADKSQKKESPKVQDAVVLDKIEDTPAGEQAKAVQSDLAAHSKEAISQLSTPLSTDEKHPPPPHLETPRYVHHFDTFTLVNDLEKGGFSKDQSVTVMKAVRNLLAENLEIAREGLVSKSDVENESYLFRAASSELKTEVQSTRRINSEKMRSERALLQYEFDILSQRVAQESMNLKDELRGLFDDKKMSARMEQRSTDSRIQELHYKITSVMAGEAKGEVEGLRWYLTRMLVFTLAGTILTGITYLSFSTRRAHKEQERQKKVAQESPRVDSGTSYTVPSRDSGTQTAPTDAVLAEIAAGKGSNAGSGYVSLG